jgi:hypothetical protein
VVALFLGILWSCAPGCGGGATLPDPGPDAGIDPSQDLSTTPPAELGMLCDWLAGRLGGYGRSRSCGGSNLSSPADQAACVTELQTAPTTCTAGDLEGCTDAVLAGPCVAGAIPAGCFNLLSDCAF